MGRDDKEKAPHRKKCIQQDESYYWLVNTIARNESCYLLCEEEWRDIILYILSFEQEVTHHDEQNNKVGRPKIS